MKLQNAILHDGTKVVLLSYRDIYDLTVYTILLYYIIYFARWTMELDSKHGDRSI
jgi:hypothetical protein